MCEHFQRIYNCQHYYVGVAVWCPAYPKTSRRCDTLITRAEEAHKDCPHCRPAEGPPVPWENMIDRTKGPVPTMKWFKLKDRRHY